MLPHYKLKRICKRKNKLMKIVRVCLLKKSQVLSKDLKEEIELRLQIGHL